MEESKRDVQQRIEQESDNFTSVSQRNVDIDEGQLTQSDQICESNPNTPGARKRLSSQVLIKDENDQLTAAVSSQSNNGNQLIGGRALADSRLTNTNTASINIPSNNGNILGIPRIDNDNSSIRGFNAIENKTAISTTQNKKDQKRRSSLKKKSHGMANSSNMSTELLSVKKQRKTSDPENNIKNSSNTGVVSLLDHQGLNDVAFNDRGYNQSSSEADDNSVSNNDQEDILSNDYNNLMNEPAYNTNNLQTKDNQKLNQPINNNNFISKDLIPPPEPLLPKTIAPTEPLRTGAPTPFLKLKPFTQQIAESPCKQTEEPVDKAKYKIDNAIMNEQSLKTLFIQEFKQNDPNNPVVYNRYSSQFGNQSSTYQNSAYQLLKSEFNPMTLLVNVKELISVETGKSGFPGGSMVLPYYTPNDENDKTLVFESRFESGNLAMAFKLHENEYNLVLSNDINTKGHTQWFFFRVTNVRKDNSVKFNLLNHTKPDSLFNFGMKVLVYSEQINKETGIGWHRDGRDIAYFQNNFKKDTVGRSRYYYTLTFTYDFKHDEDAVYFAYSYPYTYSDLTDELTNIEKDHIQSEYMSRNQKQERKGVFLSARIHPGESNSSWMMKGIIDFLVSQAPEAKVLREKFVFKIVPMLNPDGVINGNYRCSLAGADLNRRWKAPSKLLFPEVLETKKLCKQFQKERQIVLYCDLHGHSRNKDIFIYGNNYQENPESTRLFPFIMSKVLDSFSYDACRFSIHKSKESTARVAMWKELKIPAVYTMEASFCGTQLGKNAGLHFTTEHFMEAGKKLCIALLIYCDVDVPKSLREIQNLKKKRKQKNQGQQVTQNDILEEISQDLKDYTRKGLIAELMGNKNLLNAGSKGESGDDGGGSESDPSEDNMEEEEMAKIIPIKVNAPKKKPEVKKQQLPIRKQFKQEEQKEQKVQQTQSKKSPTKKFNNGGSFFDRVRLPKSYGMRRVEMVDAWTQTSNRGSDTEDQKDDKSKDEGTQAQLKDLTENNIDVSPTRPRYSIQNTDNKQFEDKQHSLFNIDSLRNIDQNASQSVIVNNPNKNRVLVPSSQKRQSLSPNKNEFSAIRDRMQAMQIINQYIKDTQQTMKTSSNPNNMQYNNDPYNFFIQQQQQQQQFYSPEKLPMNNHIYHTEKKPQVINQLQLNRPNVIDDMNQQHKRQSSNNPQNYYFDINQAQNAIYLQQIQMNRGNSDCTNNVQQNAKTLEFKDILVNSQLSQQQILSNNNQQSTRVGLVNQNQVVNGQVQNQGNINLRSLSGNSYLRSIKQSAKVSEEYNQKLTNQNQSGVLTGQSHNTIITSQPIQNNKGSFNAQHLLQTGVGNSRATTLPQLNHDSMQKSSAIKQNKSQSFYEGIKAQNSFKQTPGGVGINFKNEYKTTNDDQFFNSSFVKGNVSPIPFENMPHYSFKIKPTIIGDRSSSKQLNNSQLTNDTKRLYQSQPAQEFTPQSTHNKEQLGQVNQKWNNKNRTYNNVGQSNTNVQQQNNNSINSAPNTNYNNLHSQSNNQYNSILNNSFGPTTQSNNSSSLYNIGRDMNSQQTAQSALEEFKRQQVNIIKRRKPSEQTGGGIINATSKSFISSGSNNNQNLFIGGSSSSVKKQKSNNRKQKM